MEEWKKYRLDDFIEFNPTLSLKKGTIARKITMDQLIPHSRDIYSWVYEPYSGGSKFQNGDTIMARITPCLENGKHAFVSLLDNGETAYGSTEYIVMRGKPGISDNLFVYYFSHFPAFKNAAIKSMVGSSGRQRAQVDVLKNLEFYLPGLKEQKMIADSLSALDDKIALNNRINHNLEEQARALYKSWFVDFEPFKNGKFVDSELGLIPEGWRVATLGEVTSEMRDKVGTRQDVKVLSPVTTGQLVLSEEFFTKQVFSESIAKYLIVRPNDFAYNPARVNIGSLGKNEFDFDGCVSPVYVVFRCETGYEHFFNLYRSSNTFKEEVISRSNGGVRQTLGYKDFALIKLVYPPVSVVEEYNAIYCHIVMGIRQRKKESIVLANQRDELLPNLMTGKIPFDDLTC